MMYWYDGYWGTGMMAFMGIFWIVIIGLVIWLVARLLGQKQLIGNSNQSSSQDPMHVLKLRFAKGDISKKEYEQMKKELSK